MKIVIALGGNALGNTPKEQLEIVRESAKPIVDLIEDGHFAPGSMLSKVEAVLSKKGRKALMTSLEKASEGIKGETGTIIID